MRRMTYASAMVEALREALVADSRVSIMGSYFFGVSPHRVLLDQLRREFPTRIVDPPVSELGYLGVAIGAATAGLRPIVDLGTASFLFNGFEMVVNEAANVHYMSGGQTCAPVVFHLLHGLRGGGAAQHSHSPQAMLWNVPGLEIIVPASAADVKGLLATAIRSDNPTVFVDHVRLFGLEGAVQDGSYSIPFGKADIKRAGRDVTVVATSLMVSRSVEVADQLAETGIEVEVIDPRTLVPFDSDTIIASVLRTGRLVVVDECHRSCGVAAEIVTRVVEEAFHALKAPVKRVTTADVPVAFSGSLEEAIAPTSQKIADAVRTVMCKAF